MENLADIERRVGKIEVRQDAVDIRLEQGAKTMARHEAKLDGLCDYQDKQNGSLQRLEDRFNDFYKMLFVALLGLAFNVMLTIMR